MNALQSIVYGLVYGIAEFLPISSRGHMAIMNKIFGVAAPEPFRNFLMHISLLLAVLVCYGAYIQRLRRALKSNSRTLRKNSKNVDKRSFFDLRLIKTAATPMFILMLLTMVTTNLVTNLAIVALLFIINGLIVYIPEHLPQSNKDASQLSALDSIVMGVFAGLSVFPGISRTGASLSFAVSRGADKEKALQWVYILSVPALVLMIVFDIIQMIYGGTGIISFGYFCNCVLTAIISFGAACAGIILMRFIAVRSGFSVFGYYCWGAALLSFILYLMV